MREKNKFKPLESDNKVNKAILQSNNYSIRDFWIIFRIDCQNPYFFPKCRIIFNMLSKIF